jgi:hypothetical protein
MNATLSTTAWVLHDLGLATSVGGSLFGKVGLHPAVRAIESLDERGRITSNAWKDFTPFNLLSHAAVALTWLAGRSLLTGREVDRTTRNLVLAKDILLGAYLATGVSSIATGYALSRSRDREPPPVESGDQPAFGTPQRSRGLQRASDWLGSANLAVGAGLIGITAMLSMRSGRSGKWTLVSRLLV